MCRERERKKERSAWQANGSNFAYHRREILAIVSTRENFINDFVVEGGYQMKASRSVGGTQT